MKPLLILSLSTLLLSACGWHLRGSQGLDNIESLYISAEDSHGLLASDIRRLAENYDIALSDTPKDAQYSLIILQERDERRTISVGNDALASEYEITLATDYRIERGGEVLIPKATASVSRSYDHNPNDVLSTTEEELLLRREMRQLLIQQIMRRLRFATKNATQPEAAPAG